MLQRNYQPLSEQELKIYAPSIFSEGSAERTSDKYVHISTIELIRALAKENFSVMKAMQSRSRSEEKRAFTKHIVRFRHNDAVANANGLFPEIVLINSHDGLSSYKLMAGIYRLICANGMIAGDTYSQVRVRHQGDIVGNVIEGTYSVIKDSQKMIEHSEEMQSIELNWDEKRIFAESVHSLRFDEENEQGKVISYDKFLRVRRHEDKKDDLFTVLNVAQENLIRGGLSGRVKNKDGHWRWTTTREVKSIDQNTALNRALWTLAEKMAELKRAS